MKIEFKQQPTNVTCVHACVAMLINKPVKYVIDWANKKYGLTENDALANAYEKEILNEHGHGYRRRRLDYLAPGSIYLLSVPSLNIQAGMHRIILDFREVDWKIYDPCKGRKGKLYYSTEADGIDLLCWAEPVEIYKTVIPVVDDCDKD